MLIENLYEISIKHYTIILLQIAATVKYNPKNILVERKK